MQSSWCICVCLLTGLLFTSTSCSVCDVSDPDRLPEVGTFRLYDHKGKLSVTCRASLVQEEIILGPAFCFRGPKHMSDLKKTKMTFTLHHVITVVTAVYTAHGSNGSVAFGLLQEPTEQCEAGIGIGTEEESFHQVIRDSLQDCDVIQLPHEKTKIKYECSESIAYAICYAGIPLYMVGTENSPPVVVGLDITQDESRIHGRDRTAALFDRETVEDICHAANYEAHVRIQGCAEFLGDGRRRQENEILHRIRRQAGPETVGVANHFNALDIPDPVENFDLCYAVIQDDNIFNMCKSKGGVKLCYRHPIDGQIAPMFAVCYSVSLGHPIFTSHRISRSKTYVKSSGSSVAWRETTIDRDRSHACDYADSRRDGRRPPYYDKGHLVPNADFQQGQSIERSMTYHYTNAAPQEMSFNRRVWKKLENRIRSYASDNKGDLYVVTGTDGSFGVLGSINIPELFWKAVCDVTNKESIVCIGQNTGPENNNLKFGVQCMPVEGSEYRVFNSERCNYSIIGYRMARSICRDQDTIHCKNVTSN